MSKEEWPVGLEVSSGVVKRRRRFAPVITVCYNTGKRNSGPYHIFKKKLSLGLADK